MPSIPDDWDTVSSILFVENEESWLKRRQDEPPRGGQNDAGNARLWQIAQVHCIRVSPDTA